MDSDIGVWQISPGQSWRLIIGVMSVWNSPLYDMSVCPLLTSATAVIRISICASGKDIDIFATYTLNKGSGTVGPINLVYPPKPGPQSRAICNTVCILSIANSTLLNWSIVSVLIYFILYYLEKTCFCILVHAYNLCFTGSSCYNVGCYNYNSIRPYYIVIRLI